METDHPNRGTVVAMSNLLFRPIDALSRGLRAVCSSRENETRKRMETEVNVVEESSSQEETSQESFVDARHEDSTRKAVQKTTIKASIVSPSIEEDTPGLKSDGNISAPTPRKRRRTNKVSSHLTWQDRKEDDDTEQENYQNLQMCDTESSRPAKGDESSVDAAVKRDGMQDGDDSDDAEMVDVQSPRKRKLSTRIAGIRRESINTPRRKMPPRRASGTRTNQSPYVFYDDIADDSESTSGYQTRPVAEKKRGPPKRPRRASKSGEWSLDERLLFLHGLKLYGRGKWKEISEQVLQTR